MELVFANRKLQKVCSSVKLATKKFGTVVGQKLILRLTQLQAFDSLEDVSPHKPFRRHLLSGTYKGCFAINVIDRYRIILEPIFKQSIPDEEAQLKEIKIIKIVEVSNHYGD